MLCSQLNVNLRDDVLMPLLFVLLLCIWLNLALVLQQGREAIDVVRFYVTSSISGDDESLSSAIEETLESPYMARLRISQLFSPSWPHETFGSNPRRSFKFLLTAAPVVGPAAHSSYCRMFPEKMRSIGPETCWNHPANDLQREECENIFVCSLDSLSCRWWSMFWIILKMLINLATVQYVSNKHFTSWSPWR